MRGNATQLEDDFLNQLLASISEYERSRSGGSLLMQRSVMEKCNAKSPQHMLFVRNQNFRVVFTVGAVIMRNMRHGGKAMLCVLGGLMASSAANGIVAEDSSNPYQNIVQRNVFGLKDPPPPPSTEAPTPPPPKITINGITTILGNKRVLFKVSVLARPPQPAREESFILAEGQREGQIEVLEIDETSGTIKFNNHGQVITLTMDKDGAKLPASPPPAAPVFAAPNPGVNPGMPNAPMPPQMPANPGSVGMKTIPTRTLRMPNNANNPSGAYTPLEDGQATGLSPAEAEMFRKRYGVEPGGGAPTPRRPTPNQQ